MGRVHASLACRLAMVQTIEFEGRISPNPAAKAGGVRIRSSKPEAFRWVGPNGNGSRCRAGFFPRKEWMR